MNMHGKLPLLMGAALGLLLACPELGQAEQNPDLIKVLSTDDERRAQERAREERRVLEEKRRAAEAQPQPPSGVTDNDIQTETVAECPNPFRSRGCDKKTTDTSVPNKPSNAPSAR